MTSIVDIQNNRFSQFVVLVLLTFLFPACGSGSSPVGGRSDIPQPTFVLVDVTPAPDSAPAIATPWSFVGEDGGRAIPPGLDPELFTPAPPEEVIDLWTELLAGSTVHTASNRLYFRGRGRFEGNLHLCPDGSGYFDGEPEGSVNWSVGASVGSWFEVALTHDLPGRVEAVSFLLSVRNGLPVRLDSAEAVKIAHSDYCSIADPGIERPAFTVDERRLDERSTLVAIELEEIPWVDGDRALPHELSAESPEPLTPESSTEHWNIFLSGGVLDAVAYDYGKFVLTEAFSRSLHMCEGRVAVLEGEPSGIGEWAVQSTQSSGGASSPGAKILFTLPGDRTFRTLVLGVTADGPVLMGRHEESGLITPSPLELRESDECE